MKTTFRKSMIWLHTYLGLIAGWLLFAIFLTGTLSYYNNEISHWMTASTLPQQRQQVMLEQSINKLNQVAPNASSWYIQLPDDRGGTFRLSYREDKQRHSIYLDPNTLTEQPRPETRGGNFFRTFHYTLSLRNWGGRYFTGIAAMAMLLALFTGIYTHRRFFKDFFTLRDKDKTRFTVDFHAVSGVITIPFCFMICFSALLIYISMYQPFAINQYYDSFRDLDKQVSTRHQPLAPSGEKAQLSNDLTKMLAQLEQVWGKDMKLDALSVSNPGDSQAQLVFNRSKSEILSNKSPTIAFNSAGERLQNIELERFPREFRRVFYGLHEAHFAEPGTRAMLFILGMVSTILIATGMVIWLQKRQPKKQKKAYDYVAKTNHAAFYGLTLAIAGYFLCSKLAITSVDLVKLEMPVFFYTWLASFILCFMLPANRAKYMLVFANALAYLALVLLDVVALSQMHNLTSAHLTVSFWVTLTAIYFLYGVKQHHNTQPGKERIRA